MENNEDFYCIGIGASAGGQQALCDFFAHLSADADAAYFVVTHLAKDFRSRLNEIIQKYTDLPVVRVTEPMEVKPRTVYLLVEDRMMAFDDKGLTVRKRAGSEKINRAIDILFTSLAARYGPKAVGIVLSGAGNDGAEGVLHIKQHGGEVLVQDPGSSLFTGMPFAAIRKDDPIAIRPPAELAQDLARLLKSRLVID